MWFAFGMILSLLLLTSPITAQENGKIYHVAYSPEEPIVSEDIALSAGVENPGIKAQQYSLQLQIIKDGKSVHEEKFTFSLEKTKGISFTPKYAPQDIGEYEVIFQLYDKAELDLFDTKIMKLNVVSNIGPFDITIDPLTSRVRPGFNLPADLVLENMGKKSLDVEVKVSIDCQNQTLTQSFTFFVPAGNQTKKLISMPACRNDGLYNIIASIVLFNKTWVSSSSQFFVNTSYIQLYFDVPEKVTLNPGGSYSLPIEVTNLGNQKITDLKFVLQRIPLEWQKVSPSSVIEVYPDETAVFIVNITVPNDAEARSYEMRWTAIAEETLERKVASLEVVPLAALSATPSAEISLSRYIVIFASSAIGLVIIILLRKYLKRPPEEGRADVLKRLKEGTKSK